MRVFGHIVSQDRSPQPSPGVPGEGESLIMANFNKVILVGNLTRDPQLKYLPSQMAVVEFGLAVNRKFKTQTGEDREEVPSSIAPASARPARSSTSIAEGQADLHRGPAEVRHLGRQARRRQAHRSTRRRRKLPVHRRTRRRKAAVARSRTWRRRKPAATIRTASASDPPPQRGRRSNRASPARSKPRRPSNRSAKNNSLRKTIFRFE